MLVLFYGAGISFILLVGRPIPPTWIKEFVRVFLCPEFKMNLSLKIQMMKIVTYIFIVTKVVKKLI